MRVTNYLKATVLGLFIGLAGACTNEEFQNGLPDQTVNLKDGEILVKMNVSGIGGTVATRANENITLPGEVEIKTLDLYCFKGTGTNPDDFTLERKYHYAKLGTENDLALTPVGDGYQVSFGVPKGGTDNRAFVLIANDVETRTADNSLTLSVVKGWKILETALSGTPNNISTPLPMTAIAGRTTIGTTGTLDFDHVYTPDDIKDGAALKAELKRPISRIDVKNPAAIGFTVTSVTLKGAANSVLFPGSDNGNVPEATSSGGFALLDFEANTINVSAEMIPAALYAYPVKNSGDGTPQVTIKGTLGSGGEIMVTATFGDAMTAESKGMMPNTRYIVNLYNSEGNITADITIAEWNAGETIDTDDMATKLNGGATLNAATGKATLDADNRILNITYYNSEGPIGCNVNDVFATIESTTNDAKPIGIILPDDCDWIEVEDKTSENNGTAKYDLKLMDLHKGAQRPRTATLSIVTYDTGNSKQIIQEYVIHQDYVDITKLTEAFPKPGKWPFYLQCISADEKEESDYVNTYKFSPFGVDYFLLYQIRGSSVTEGYDIIVPEDCSWLTKTGFYMGGAYHELISMSDNIGMQERRATLELRRWKANPGAIETKKFTIIQSGTVDKKVLSDVAQVILNPEAVSKNLLRMEGNTIYLASETAFTTAGSNVLSDGRYLISVRGGAQTSSGHLKPVWVNMEAGNNPWLVVTGGHFDIANWIYMVEFQYIPGISFGYGDTSRETSFTVTTYANGAPVVNTYRVIQMSSGAGLDGETQKKE